MKRALSVSDLYNKRRNVLEFDGQWLAGIGRPELKGSWMICGPSRMGKTAFAIQCCKYLTKWTRVAYDSLEEGDSESLKAAFRRQRMEEVKRKVIILDKESIPELIERLEKKRSPGVIVIDSVQYAFIKLPDYYDLLKRFPNKLFIWISHEKNKEPQGFLAQKIWYDAMVKVRVSGYRAFIASRYLDGEGENIDVWKEGAARAHAEMF
jgi:hypothetical protein